MAVSETTETTGTERRTRRGMMAAAGAAAGVLLAACGQNATSGAGGEQAAGQAAPSKPTGKATYLYHIGVGPEYEQYQEVARRFNARGTGQIEIAISEGQGYLVKLQSQIAGGDAPESTFMAAFNMPEWADRGALEPLDSRVSRDKFDLKKFFDASVALGKARIQGSERLYALPRHPSPAVLFYNKSRFDARGIKAPDATWTWDTYLDAAKKLTQGDDYGTIAPYHPFYLHPFFRSWGAEILDKDLKKFQLDQAPGPEAVQWVADLAVRQNAAMPFNKLASNNDRAPWYQGKIGMVMDIYPNVANTDTNAKGAFQYDVALLPKGTKGRINRNVAGTYVLVKGAKNPEVGWEWLKFLTSKETMTYLSTTIFPAQREAASSPEFLNPSNAPTKINRKAFVDALEQDTSLPEPNTAKYGEIEAMIQKALVPVWNGEQDARSALQAISAPATALLPK